jgi:hypothetical protein
MIYCSLIPTLVQTEISIKLNQIDDIEITHSCYSITDLTIRQQFLSTHHFSIQFHNFKHEYSNYQNGADLLRSRVVRRFMWG